MTGDDTNRERLIELALLEDTYRALELDLRLREWSGSILQYFHACMRVDYANEMLNNRYRRGFTIDGSRQERKLPIANSDYAKAGVRRFRAIEVVNESMVPDGFVYVGAMELVSHVDTPYNWDRILIDRGRITGFEYQIGALVVEDWNYHRAEDTIVGHHNNGTKEEVFLVTAGSFNVDEH